MIKKTKIKITIFLLSTALVILFINIAIYNKPHINVAKSTPDISLVSQKLLNDFENDENLANSKYLEQIIQVTGKISELSKTKENLVVTLNNDNSLGSVMCHLSVEESKKAKGLKIGENITLKGVCTGYLMDVILIKCVIIN
ncbi:hypothetical protein [Aquimarina sp. MMG016]|uniref:OB-fold protein n=1 Tax=Aquimarina sp. MMG016 TaxID=2822690 RepID=UPI001B39E5E3|nr:hypothetical protein [Aquimarina sp. MMG016]MBQ4819412.1 hypothetical protein [Aquimarina sp. MMG016]